MMLFATLVSSEAQAIGPQRELLFNLAYSEPNSTESPEISTYLDDEGVTISIDYYEHRNHCQGGSASCEESSPNGYGYYQEGRPGGGQNGFDNPYGSPYDDDGFNQGYNNHDTSGYGRQDTSPERHDFWDHGDETCDALGWFSSSCSYTPDDCETAFANPGEYPDRARQCDIAATYCVSSVVSSDEECNQRLLDWYEGKFDIPGYEMAGGQKVKLRASEMIRWPEISIELSPQIKQAAVAGFPYSLALSGASWQWNVPMSVDLITNTRVAGLYVQAVSVRWDTSAINELAGREHMRYVECETGGNENYFYGPSDWSGIDYPTGGPDCLHTWYGTDALVGGPIVLSAEVVWKVWWQTPFITANSEPVEYRTSYRVENFRVWEAQSILPSK